MTDPVVSPWYLAPCGITDHAYVTCPGLQRETKGLQRDWEALRQRAEGWGLSFDVEYPEIHEGVGALDPELEMCGWCRRVWLARNSVRGDERVG